MYDETAPAAFRASLALALSSPFRLSLLSHPVGEVAAGKASRSLAQHIPGPGGIEGMKGAASGVVGELARARIALDERGQKLGELEERTAAMMASADSFSKHAHEVTSSRLLEFLNILDLTFQPVGGSLPLHGNMLASRFLREMFADCRSFRNVFVSVFR